MTSEEKIMERFEEWIMEQASHGVFMGGFTEEEEAATRLAWKASRESLVVELPEMDWLGDDENGEFGYTEYSIRESIHAAGVKTK